VGGLRLTGYEQIGKPTGGGIRDRFIGRVDITDPNTDAPNDRLTRYIAGASYQLTPAVRLLADVDDLEYQGVPTPPSMRRRRRLCFRRKWSFEREGGSGGAIMLSRPMEANTPATN
jgi:hypothetical protein